jgi:hypothetical protein
LYENPGVGCRKFLHDGLRGAAVRREIDRDLRGKQWRCSTGLNAEQEQP